MLVAGALVNVFRPQFAPDMFGGVETPVGNTAAITGDLLVRVGTGARGGADDRAAVRRDRLVPGPAPLARAVVIGAVLAGLLGAYAARRAARLRAA